MSPFATYMHKPEPKSWRGIQKMTKNFQKHFVRKLFNRHLSRRGDGWRVAAIGRSCGRGWFTGYGFGLRGQCASASAASIGCKRNSLSPPTVKNEGQQITYFENNDGRDRWCILRGVEVVVLISVTYHLALARSLSISELCKIFVNCKHEQIRSRLFILLRYRHFTCIKARFQSTKSTPRYY